jgi:hypothetical protein
LNKAMYERVYGKPYEMDDRDRELLAEKTKAWEARQDGPRVGDFVITPKGLLRFTHDWGEDIQTTVKPGYDASFYLSDGGMSFSGSLSPGIPKALLELTGEVMEGSCWFFSHGFAEASNGVHATVPCRVYRLLSSGETE